jgi:hypothetical protein
VSRVIKNASGVGNEASIYGVNDVLTG